MGFNITKQGNISLRSFEHFLGYHIFVENLDRPLKVKIYFFKVCLVYGICQKHIGNAKNAKKNKNNVLMKDEVKTDYLLRLKCGTLTN